MSPVSQEMDTSRVFVANTSFSTDLDGAAVTITRGVTRVRGGHPLVVSSPQYFDLVDEGVHYDVEQASAAPGEKRGEPTKEELLERARALDIEGRTQMDKPKLAEAVVKAEKKR